MPKPALLTRTSTVRSRAAISAARRSRSAGAARSAATTSARIPWASRSSDASSSSRSARRATSVTPCPRDASSRANALPMPAEAPVTSAVESGSGGGSATSTEERQPTPARESVHAFLDALLDLQVLPLHVALVLGAIRVAIDGDRLLEGRADASGQRDLGQHGGGDPPRRLERDREPFEPGQLVEL